MTHKAKSDARVSTVVQDALGKPAGRAMLREETAATQTSAGDHHYRTPPFHRNFARRAKIRVLKSLTRCVAHIHLLAARERRGARLVSVKNGKAVFHKGASYLSVYLHGRQREQMHQDIPYALQPDKIINSHIVRYPAVDISRPAPTADVLGWIAAYTQPSTRMGLGAFIAKYHHADRSPIFTQLKSYVLSRYDHDLQIDVALCHGDVTRHNIGFRRDGRAVLFDWDDAFEHITSYDRVYYLLSEYFYDKKIDFTYGNVLRQLGFGGRIFVFGNARQFIAAAIGTQLSDLDCALFLLRYLKTVIELDGVSGILLGDIDEVVF